MTVIIRHPQIRQPAGTPVLSLESPFSTGLLGFATPKSTHLAAMTNGGTATTRFPGKTGLATRAGFSNSSTTNFDSAPFPCPKSGDASKGITLYARIKPISHGDTATSWASGRFHVALEFGISIGIGIASTAAGSAGIAVVVALGAFRTASVAITLGNWYDVFVEVPDNTASSYGRIYVVGVGSAQTSTGSENFTFSSCTLYFGHKVSTSSPGDRYVECAAAWNRLLTDAEKERFAANPYQVLQTRKLIIPYQAAGATAPTLSALSAINVTATTAQPRMTYTF